MEVKICSKCKKELPKTNEYFYSTNRVKSGLTSACRKCLGGKYKKQPEEGFRICSRCQKEFPATLDFFTQNKYGQHGLASICKECEKLKKKKYRKENQDKIKSYRESIKEHKRKLDKAYYEANKEKIREYHAKHYRKNFKKIQKKNKQYYEENKEQIIARNKIYETNNIDKVRKWKKKWRDTNPEKVALISQKRRADKLNTKNSLTLEQWEQCLEFFNYKDAYTGLPMNVISQDHIIPISKGGPYIRENIVPCEININCSKQDSDMEEWFRKQTFFSEERLFKIYKWINL